MTAKGGRSLLSLTFPAGLLLLIGLVELVHHRHDFILLEVDAFVIPKQASPFFRFPKSSFLDSPPRVRPQTQMNIPTKSLQQMKPQKTKLCSTSASAAYLESISYRPPSPDDGLLGATSKYLDALSSVSNQLQTSTGNYQYYAQKAYNEGGAATDPLTSAAHVQASVEAASTTVPFSEDQLVNEVVQRVTQEFSTALEAFAGETYDSFLNSASTLVADSTTTAYIWDIEETETKVRKGGRAMKETVQKGIDAVSSGETTSTPSPPPEETLRELTSKLDSTFRSFKENLYTSTHSVTSSFAGSIRSQTSQPNAAVQAAKQSENISGVKQKIASGALTPEALSTNAKEAVDLASSVANKAMVDLELASPLSTGAAATSAISKSLSEKASSVDAAIGDVTSKMAGTQQDIQQSIGSLFANTNQGIVEALSSAAKTTTAATSSIAETTNAATSSAIGSIGAVGSSISSGASAAASGVSSSIGAVGANLASGATSVTSGVQSSVGALGSSAKAAVVTAQPGTSATAGKISAVALSGSQGFGMPGNAYTGGGDVAGMIEMTVATILSIPRTILETAMMETNPNGVNGLMDEISGSLTNDILVPLSEPLREVASQGKAPLDQAQAVLETLQMVLALVVGIPRAALEGLTGLTIGEIQLAVSQTDVRALAEQLSGFASAVSTVLVSLLQVIAQAISVIVTQTGLGSAVSSGQEELVTQLSRFVVEDLLPAILDGLFLILQQFAMLLLEGGSAMLAAM